MIKHNKHFFNIQKNLQILGKSLPRPPQAVGTYKPFITVDKVAFISGQLPLKDGCIIYKGKVGNELNIEEGIQAAELCALNILSQISELQKKHIFKQLIRIEGYINSNSSFTKHAVVLDGASDLFSSVLLKKAGHTRSVIGCSSLPLSAAIEIVATLEIDEYH